MKNQKNYKKVATLKDQLEQTKPYTFQSFSHNLTLGSKGEGWLIVCCFAPGKKQTFLSLERVFPLEVYDEPKRVVLLLSAQSGGFFMANSIRRR